MSEPTSKPETTETGIGQHEEMIKLLEVAQASNRRSPSWTTSVPIPITATRTGTVDFAIRQQAVQEVAKADPNNIQEVAASLLSITNSYYESGLHQSKRSFNWSLIWGAVGLGFLIACIGFLLIRQPAEVAVASGAIGAAVGAFASRYQSLYKLASNQLAEFRVSMERTQQLLLANSICEMLEGEVKQTKRAELISRMVESAVRYSSKEKDG